MLFIATPADQLKQYITQLRYETAERFVKTAFVNDQPNKVPPGALSVCLCLSVCPLRSSIVCLEHWHARCKAANRRRL